MTFEFHWKRNSFCPQLQVGFLLLNTNKRIQMKKVLLGMAIIAASASVQADSAVTLGYAQSALKEASNSNGFALGYSYVPAGQKLGVITSVLHTRGDDNSNGIKTNYTMTSLSVGPMYSVTESLDVYSTLGFMTGKADIKSDSVKGTVRDTATTLGAGIQYSFENNFVTKLGMEKTLNNDIDAINFIIGGGYRF
ncbi:hypothetical protein C9J48_06480 [Photobacterium profundum]|nr:hypothetical protein C9J48_06480 [Photobacterium profundum]